jgi:hypothetical protein
MESLVIPDSVRNIGQLAFGDSKVRQVTFEGSDVKIGFLAFGINLKKFNVPASSTSVASNSYSLSTLSLAFGITKFYDFDKTTEIPATLEAIGGYTWSTEGMPAGSAYKIADPQPETFTYTWMNYDGTVIQKIEDVSPDEWPWYEGEDPVNEFGLTFCGWNSVEDRYGNVILLAAYKVGEVTDVGGNDGMGEEEGGDVPESSNHFQKTVTVIVVIGLIIAFLGIRFR